MREKIPPMLYPLMYRIMYVLLFTGILLHGFGRMFGVWSINGSIWAVAVITVILTIGINYSRTNGKIICGIVFVFLLAIVMPMIVSGQVKEFWTDYLNWVLELGEYNREWGIGYSMVQTVWIVVCAYLVAVLMEELAFTGWIVLLCFLGYLLTCLFMEWEISHITMSLMVCFFLMFYLEKIRIYWNKKKKRDTKEYMIWLLPFLAVYLSLSLLIPANELPYNWNLLHSAYYNIRDKVISFLGNQTNDTWEDFGFGIAGFSDEARLQDGFVKNNKELFTIEPTGIISPGFYLVGKTYDTFQNMEWTVPGYEDIQEYPLDIMETRYAVMRHDPEYMSDYLKTIQMSVKHQYFYTGYVFTPGKCTKIVGTEYERVGRDVHFLKKAGYETKYETVGYDLNRTADSCEEMLNTKLPEDKDVWQALIDTYPGITQRKYTLEDLYAYRKDVKRIYGKEVTVSEDVANYLKILTKDCETDYQKLRAIEKELSGYAYTNNPRKVPVWVAEPTDFLDFFLLESKEGYCSYFATAFVLLARAEGIPARYVEGFCVPRQDSEIMMVTSSMAHAWPEAYLEGIGWIPFEPTPGYGNNRYWGWQVESREKDAEISEEDISIPPSFTPLPMQPDPTQEELEQIKKQEKKKQSLIFFNGAILILGLGCLVLLGERIRQQYIYRHMNPEDKFLTEVKKNLWVFAGLGYKREETETLNELKIRILEEKSITVVEEELAFLEHYQNYLYGSIQITEQILDKTIQIRKKLLLQIKQERKLFYMFLILRMGIWG